MTTATRTLRRIYHYLTRSQARAGWLLAIVCTVLYAAYPEGWQFYDPIRQFLLVVASVAVGAVFLPELSSNLWSFKADEVRGLIPDDKIKSLESSIVHAQIDDPEWADAVLESGLRPMTDAHRHPERIFADLAYSVSIHLDRNADVDGTSIRAHRVETTLRARRTLPAPSGELYWIAIARTHEALNAEYDQPACLLREIVEFDESWSDDKWRAAVESLSSSRIIIDGRTTEAVTAPAFGMPPPVTPGLVRWYFPAGELPEPTQRARRTVVLAFDFPQTDDYFAVMFKSYYAIGSTNVSVRVYGDTARRLEYVPFFGRALGKGQIDIEYKRKDELCQQISATTSDDTMVWPGSGMLVWWGAPRSAPGSSEPAPAATLSTT